MTSPKLGELLLLGAILASIACDASPDFAGSDLLTDEEARELRALGYVD